MAARLSTRTACVVAVVAVTLLAFPAAGGSLRRLIGDEVDLVGPIVTYDGPTASIVRYAPYELKVNGVTHPGG
jgi:hypothetical protein